MAKKPGKKTIELRDRPVVDLKDLCAREKGMSAGQSEAVVLDRDRLERLLEERRKLDIPWLIGEYGGKPATSTPSGKKKNR